MPTLDDYQTPDSKQPAICGTSSSTLVRLFPPSTVCQDGAWPALTLNLATAAEHRSSRRLAAIRIHQTAHC
jgi:hypothetical protein